MLTHIVIWKIAADEAATKAEHAAVITAELMSLPAVIPEVQSMRVSTNVVDLPTNWDIVITTEYADEAALHTYIDHPEHQRVAAIVRGLVSDRAGIDFLA